MNLRPKRLPRLWCARLGLLPFGAARSGSGALNGASPDPRPTAALPSPAVNRRTPSRIEAERGPAAIVPAVPAP